MLHQNANRIFDAQMNYIKKSNVYGYDPFDGLNSPIAQLPLIKDSKLLKLILLQFNKRSVFNFRPLLGIKKHRNPKAVALVVSALIIAGKGNEEESFIKDLLSWLINNKSPNFHEYCWGYPFDWQSLTFFQPKHMPTVVASSFVGQAFLDAYELYSDPEYLRVAESVGEFMLKQLNRTPCLNGFCLSYSPSDHSVVYNASALGAKHLAKLYKFTGKAQFREAATKSIQPIINEQNEDGSWNYGAAKHHKWIDNFHTGYNLECLYQVIALLKITEYLPIFENGLNYYINNLFMQNGFPKYYSNKNYPVDTHAPAQFLITLFKSNKMIEYKDKVNTILNWWLDNMYNNKNNLFVYQLTKFGKNRINYMRWTQCWALYGLAAVYKGSKSD